MPEISPMNASYRAMTAAWRAGDYTEAWDRADVMMQALASGQPPPDSVADARYWIGWIHRLYSPAGPVPRENRTLAASDMWTADDLAWLRLRMITARDDGTRTPDSP
jgi:hypothetical protein